MQYRGFAISIDRLQSIVTVTDKAGNHTHAYFDRDLPIDQVLAFAKTYIDGKIELAKPKFTLIDGGRR